MSEQQELKEQICVFQRMIEELPDTVSRPLLDQLLIVVKAVIIRDKAVRDFVTTELDDVRLNFKLMEFDLESTKAEKQALQDKLEGNG